MKTDIVSSPMMPSTEDDDDFGKSAFAQTNVPFGDVDTNAEVVTTDSSEKVEGIAEEGQGEGDEPPTTPPPRMRARSSMKAISSYEEPGSGLTPPNSSGKRTSLLDQQMGKRRTVGFGRNECLEYDITSPPSVTLVENGGRYRRKSNLPMQMKLKQYSISDLPDIYPDDDSTIKRRDGEGLNCCPIL